MRLEDRPSVVFDRPLDTDQLNRRAGAESASPLDCLGPTRSDEERGVRLCEDVVRGEQTDALSNQVRKGCPGVLVLALGPIAQGHERTRVDEDPSQP